MLRVAGSLAFWLMVTVSSVALFPVAAVIRLATSHRDPRLRALHRFTSFWASLYTWLNPFWRVTFEGLDRLPQGRHVIVANHQSMADIFVLFRLPLYYKWVSKEENFRIPFVGWNMTLNRYVRIRRGTVKGNLQMMRDSEDALREGSSVMIFPEGTRSADGVLRPFKNGAFELAWRTRSPILPVVIDGTARALPHKGILLEPGQRIRVRVLPPVPPDAATDAEGLNRLVHTNIARNLAELRTHSA